MPVPIARRPNTMILRLAALLATGCLVQAAAAQKADSAPKAADKSDIRYGLVPHRFTIAAGGFLPNVSSGARLSSPTNPGTSIDLENKLGLSSNIQNLVVDATIRLGKKQLITLGYFSFKRSATRTLSDSIVFGDTVYNASATINANTQLTYYGLTYRYYFWHEPRWEIGAGLGIDALDLSAALAIRVAAGGGGFTDSASRKGGFTAPAPMLGIYGDWEFQPKFFLRGQLQYLYINNVESYGGSVSDDRLAVEWYPFRNYGVGLVYHYVNLQITKDFKNGDDLKLTYTIQGPALYLTAAF